jgi:hypothetical protein
MNRKTACSQALGAILRSGALDHGRSQKIRDEARKCPRSSSAWTLCENRPPLLATDGLRANLYAQRPDARLHWLAVLEASYLTIAQSKKPDRGTLFPDDIQRADHRRLGQNSWLPRHAEDSRALDGSAGGNGGTTGILPPKC